MTQTINGGPGIDSLTGTNPGDSTNPDGIDIINGFAGDDTLLGLGGDDIIQGGLGGDDMDGGAGVDTLTYVDATAGVGVALNAFGTYGEAIGDTISGFENLTGSAYNDQLAGDGGNNIVDGGDGDDYIQLSGGVDTLIGGAGRDLIDGRVVGAAIIINLTTGTGSGGGMAAGTTLSGFELVLGSAFDDTITANLNLGTDLVGFDGADTLNGANGDDQLFGDSYAGILVTGGADTLNGGDGNDRLEGGAFGDVLNGGAGIDTIIYSGSAAGVTINLATGAASGGEAQGDTIIDVENVEGSKFDDRLTGDALANRLAGDDGNDTLAGGAGADTLIGGAGVDTADYSTSLAGVTVNLTSGTGSGGDAEGDTLSGIENLRGSGLDDTLTGNAGANDLAGGGGNDTLRGGGGNDVIDGGAGSGDVAVFSGNRADYTVTFDGTTFTVVDRRGGSPDGTDQVTNVENFQFADRTETDQTVLNDAPTLPATNTVSTNEDTASLAIVIGAADLNGDTLNYAVKAGSEPTRGSVAFVGDTFVYTPAANANGADSFVIVVSDGRGGSAEQTVTVSIAAVNDMPGFSGAGPAVAATEQIAVVLDANIDVTDAELDALAGGAGNYAGAVLTLSRQGGASAEDGFSLPEGTDVHAAGGVIADDNGRAYAAYSVAGGVLTVTFTSDERPATSALVDAVLRSIAYTNSSDRPPASVVLEYTFTDGNQGAQGSGGPLAATAQLTVNIGAVNDAPVGAATAQLPDGTEDQPYIVSAADLLQGFSDPDGDALSVVNLAMAGGSVVDNGDGTFTITPPANFSGGARLTYDVVDGNGGVLAAEIGFRVDGENDEAVIGGEDRGAVTEAGRDGPGRPTASGQLTIVDPEGLNRFEPVEAGTPSIRGFGTVEMSGDGAWVYTLDNTNPAVEALAAGQTLTDRVVVAAADGTQHTIVIEITGADDETQSPQPAWSLLADDVALVAATYQFFTGSVPQAVGFEYLILSSDNATDLNDPYYAGFNTENLYINFASNLGTAGQGAALFDAIYGGLDFEQTVKLAYSVITGGELSGAALDFFLDAEAFYQAVAAERVVRPGVDLAEATKIVAIGSILNEAVKGDTGLLGEAVNDFAEQLRTTGTSDQFGESLFAVG